MQTYTVHIGIFCTCSWEQDPTASPLEKGKIHDNICSRCSTYWSDEVQELVLQWSRSWCIFSPGLMIPALFGIVNPTCYLSSFFCYLKARNCNRMKKEEYGKTAVKCHQVLCLLILPRSRPGMNKIWEKFQENCRCRYGRMSVKERSWRPEGQCRHL